MSAERATSIFHEHFGSKPMVVASAPGRVNLIGEHTDYNEGFVLPMAIPQRAWAAMSLRNDRRSVAHSELGEIQLAEQDCEPTPRGGWHDVVRGVLCELDAHVDVCIASDVPRGSGLSSSAAVAMAVARGVCALRDIAWDAVTMARLGQRAENVYAGVACGIMDQLVIAAADASPMLIDCRDLSVRQVAMPADVVIVVMDTGVRRRLSSSEYNARRRECESAAATLRHRDSAMRALRDANLKALEMAAPKLTSTELRRARHVVTENERVREFAEALERRDFARAGALMDASHRSLREDFEASGPQLDIVCDLAREHAACYGARLTGAGFGGCAIALVRADAAATFIADVRPKYGAATYQRGNFFIATPAPGARIDARTGTPAPPAAG